MKKEKIINLLKNHGINVVELNNKLYAEEVYTLKGKTYSNWKLVDTQNSTIGGEKILDWLGYE